MFAPKNINTKEEPPVETVFLILAKTVQIAIELAMLAMMIRMIMPLFLDVENSVVYSLCCYVSEPFIIPVRFIMVKLNIGQDSPIDWSFFTAYLVLCLLQFVLPAI